MSSKNVRNRKAVFTYLYYAKNLGDDLMLKVISERYKKCIFYGVTTTKYPRNCFGDNVKLVYVPPRIYSLLNKFSFSANRTNPVDSFYINKSSAVITLGGSIFMEGITEKYILNRYKRIKKPQYILDSNIGPFKTKTFLNDVLDSLSRATDVCVRDSYSYELAKSNSNTRLASDIVFNLTLPDLKKTPKNKVAVISVINCDEEIRKIPGCSRERYDDLMVKIINSLVSYGYSVSLMSFCKAEGDESAIERIMSKVSAKEKLSTFFYDGNINEAIEHIKNASLIVASRFHANILGMLFEKAVIPICYSRKTIDMLADSGFTGSYINLEKFSDKDINNALADANSTTKPRYNKSYFANARRHFDKLDRQLADE